MRVRLSEPARTRDLIRYLRAKDYLAVEEDGAVIAVPIRAVSERADLKRFALDVAQWQADHRGVLAWVAVEPS